jgi:hypothetical protein
LLGRLVELEGDVLYQEPPSEGGRGIGSVRGTVPVLLSAPHGAVHTRRGEPKEEEEFTAAMACLVAELTDAHALYARRRSPTDPNWYPDVPSAQLELHPSLRVVERREDATLPRPFHGDRERIRRMVEALVDIVLVATVARLSSGETTDG